MAKNIELISALKEYFGFETFKGNQEAIIENLLAERHCYITAHRVDEEPGRCHAQLQ